MEINLKEVKESFVATTRDLLQRTEALLLELERGHNPEHFTEMLRAIHTIKGNAGIFELEGVIRLCHALETFLEGFQSNAQALSAGQIDLGLTVIDRIRSLVAVMDDAEKLAGIATDDLVAQLSAKAGRSEASAKENTRKAGSGLDRLREQTQKLRLPEKYLEAARSKNHYLIFMIVDLGDQGSMTISDFYAKLLALHKSGQLLSLGVLRKETITSNPAGPFLPYFMILHSEEKAESLIRRLGIKVLLFHYFSQPQQRTEAPDQSNTVAPQQEVQRDHHVRDTHLKVHLDLLNSLIDITGEIVLTRNALVRRVEHAADQSLNSFAKKLSYLVSDLQDKVMKTRLQKLDVLFHRFPRLVRETAQLTGKKAELQIEGGDIEIDKAIIDEIADPLVHIVRNAVDHGIETAAERLAAGKKETGRIILQAQAREGNIVIRVADDGKGLDLDKIRNIAISKGLISRESAAHATASDITEYLFLPGFSTKSEVTTISGRGVGMDVVRTNISKLGGSVEIAGEQGRGTVVTMVIPQTLSILTCLTVEIDGFRFVIPQQNIVEVVQIDPGRLKNIQNKMAYELRQRLLPLIDTDELLEIPKGNYSLPFIVVVRTEKYNYGLMVQTILDTEEVVVKPLPQFGQERQIFSGAAIMGDGRIAPILDAALIGRHSNLIANAENQQLERVRNQIAEAIEQYLLFRVHGRNVAFRVIALPRIEAIDPQSIETIVDRQVVNYRNEIIPILSTDFLRYDDSAGEVLKNLIILQSEGRRYGLLAAEILDIVEEKLTLRREAGDRSEIEGYAIIKDETAIVLNIAEMMQKAIAAAAPQLSGAVS
jgi:two-component system chemotaxis sensor kinase CheA